MRPGRFKNAHAPPAEVPAHRPFFSAAGAGGIVRGLPARWGYPPATPDNRAPHPGGLLEHNYLLPSRDQ